MFPIQAAVQGLVKMTHLGNPSTQHRECERLPVGGNRLLLAVQVSQMRNQLVQIGCAMMDESNGWGLKLLWELCTGREACA